MNVFILADLIARIKLAGFSKYLHSGIGNIFEIIVVSICLLLFFLVIISSSLQLKLLEEIGEEFFLGLWSVFQFSRMIIFFKKQNEAHTSAKTLIDFSNVMESEI